MMADDLTRFTKSLRSRFSSDPTEYQYVVRASARRASQHLTDSKLIESLKKDAMWACRELESRGLRAVADWHRGYFYYRVQKFDRARSLFHAAEAGLESDLAYWLDRGRFEYNTGFLVSALRAFETAKRLAEKQGIRDAQVYRWLSKTHRWLGEFEREAEFLERGLLEYSSDQKSLDLAFDHLGRAFLACGKYREALAFATEWFGWPHNCQVEFACVKAEALCRLGLTTEAVDYAERVAKKFDQGEFVRHSTGVILERSLHGENPDGSEPIGVGQGALVIATALRHADLPFTADNALIQAFVTSSPTSSLQLTHETDARGETWVAMTELDPEGARLTAAAHLAMKTGRVDLASELLLAAAGYLLGASTSRPIALCLAQFNRIAPEHSRLPSLYREAQNRFPNDALLQTHLGRFHFGRREYEPALRCFQLALELGEPLAEPMVARTLGELGDHDAALRQFTGLLGRSWRAWSPEAVADAVYAPALAWAESSGYYVDGLNWALRWIEQANGAVTLKPAAAVFLVAGRCALALGAYGDAYANFRKASAAQAHWFDATRPLEFSLPEYARVSALAALAAFLAGEYKDADEWLKVTRAQNPGETTIVYVEGLLLAHDERFEDARDHLLKSNSADRLWAVVARLVAARCRHANRQDIAELLERRADIATGHAPSAEVALGQLIEAREAVRSGEHFKTVLTAVFAAIDQNAMFDEDNSLRQTFHDVLNTGKVVDPEALAQQVAKRFIQKARKSGVEGSVFSQKLGDDWWLLPEDLRSRLDDGQCYLAWADAEKRSDYGTVVVSISTCVERLFDRLVIAPLMSETQRIGLKPPWGLRFTLGKTAIALGLRPTSGQQQIDPRYAAIVSGWRSTLPADVLLYFDTRWMTATDPLVGARNSWAHTTFQVTASALEPLIAEAIGGRGSQTILGCLLAIQCHNGTGIEDGVERESQ